MVICRSPSHSPVPAEGMKRVLLDQEDRRPGFPVDGRIASNIWRTTSGAASATVRSKSSFGRAIGGARSPASAARHPSVPRWLLRSDRRKKAETWISPRRRIVFAASAPTRVFVDGHARKMRRPRAWAMPSDDLERGQAVMSLPSNSPGRCLRAGCRRSSSTGSTCRPRWPRSGLRSRRDGHLHRRRAGPGCCHRRSQPLTDSMSLMAAAPRRPSAARSAATSAAVPVLLLAQIGADDVRVVAHRLGRAVGDLAPVVKHDDVVGDLRRRSCRARSAGCRSCAVLDVQQAGSDRGTRGVEAGGRLVQTQKHGLSAHGARFPGAAALHRAARPHCRLPARSADRSSQ